MAKKKGVVHPPEMLQAPPSLKEPGRTRVHARGRELLSSIEPRRGKHSRAFPSIYSYPREIWLKDEPWEIRFKRKLEEDGEPLFGLCATDEKVIYIRLRQGRRHTFESFIHELLHAMEEAYGFEIPHAIVYLLERAVADFVLDNWASWRMRPAL